MKNTFFTEIAKDYNAKIEAVAFGKLEKYLKGKVIHSSFRDTYFIDIDDEKMRCVYQILFVLFHEIAHIQLFHLGYRYHCDPGLKEAREVEADQWGFKELGVIDHMNRPTADNKLCHKCITTNSAVCLKHKT